MDLEQTTRSDKNHLWGRDQLMVTSAVRYCLGRQTYIVGDCVEWLLKCWPLFSEKTRAIIRRDIEYAFEHSQTGADMDTREWEKVRQLF